LNAFRLPSGQVVFNDWYATEKAKLVLATTNGGMMMFAWEACLEDGTVIRQFGDVVFSRAMTDEDFVPSEDSRLSVDTLAKERVSQFRLHPIAFVKKNCPWFQQPIVVRLNLKRDERLTSFWETDFTPTTGYTLRRTVIGLKSKVSGEEISTFVVLSPSGQITICGDTNQSFEGE
jgi:hypothetical protein